MTILPLCLKTDSEIENDSCVCDDFTVDAGLLFEAQSLHKEALVAYSISLSIEPDFVPSLVSTAETLIKMGGSGSGTHTVPIARSFLMNTLRLEPTNHDAWFNLGLICKKEGLMRQAADFFQAAHELKLSAPVQSFV